MATEYGEALTALESAVRLEVGLWQALEVHRDGVTTPGQAQQMHDKWLAAFQETRLRLEELQIAKLGLELPCS